MLFAMFQFLGLYELTHDNRTEHLRTINILERFNIYQEVILGILYRGLPQSTKVWDKNITLLSLSEFQLNLEYQV